MTKLKPCPFCGNPNPVYWCYPKDEKTLFTDRWSVLCFYSDGGCGSEGSHQKSKEEAAIAWNERHPQIVRCKDCKHFNTTGCAEGYGWCEKNGSGHGSTSLWFCADGERR